MLNKLKEIKQHFEELTALISDPGIISDRDKFKELSREHSAIAPIIKKYDEYLALADENSSCRELLESEADTDMREMIQLELSEQKKRLAELLDELKLLLLPKDENDDKNVVVEIRAGTGGDEAALFGAVLMNMYLRYAERHRLKTEIISLNETEMNGVKEAVFTISGKGAYSRLKYECGVHRVQRVPETESQGRIHTSAATVAVLPEAEDVEVDINPTDLKIDTYRSSGAGGQHVNKTESAIRITHIPSGLIVECQDERSQTKNKEKAMRVLKTRLLDLYREQQQQSTASERKAQLGSGDRSERIRTYNFPQNRVTDHRINITMYKLDAFIDGDMDGIIEELILAERAEKLSASEQAQ